MSDDIRDEQLSRLYREAEAAAPPEALDRAILAASRAALAMAFEIAPVPPRESPHDLNAPSISPM